jgi:hypothetical protein
MSFLDRLPLPKNQGKRELIFVIALFITIAALGFIGGQTGLLYKDVPTSTPAAIVATPTEAPGTPPAN